MGEKYRRYYKKSAGYSFVLVVKHWKLPYLSLAFALSCGLYSAVSSRVKLCCDLCDLPYMNLCHVIIPENV